MTLDEQSDTNELHRTTGPLPVVTLTLEDLPAKLARLKHLERQVDELQQSNTALVYALRDTTHLTDEVRVFARLADQPLPHVPTVPSREQAVLRLRLILEEVAELCDAMGFDVSANYVECALKVAPICDLWRQADFDMVEVADALADIAFVVAGAFAAFGIDSKAVVAEVCRSNRTKLVDGRLVKNEAGKVTKGPSYEAPRLNTVLLSLGWRP